nr:hypothetical protein [uncultured Microbacterium sp.]
MSTDSPSLPDESDPATSATSPAADESFSDDDGVLYDDDVTPEYGVLGFTLRELLIVGAWLVLFILSFLPLGWSPPLWAQGISWVLPVAVPTVAVFLIVLRRFSPDGIRRVGSLGIDQFASVAFAVAAVWWLQLLWDYVSLVAAAGVGTVVWVPWAQFVVALALVALTVFAPLIPGLKDDFHGRLVTLAHRNANPVRPVIARPRPEAAPVASTDSDDAPHTPADAHRAEDATGVHVDDEAYPAASAQEGAAAPLAPAPHAAPEFAPAPTPFVAPAPYAPPADAPARDEQTDMLSAADASHVADPEPSPAPHTRRSIADAGLDAELSGAQATDEVARLDVAEQVPLASHASGGDTGTSTTTSDEGYVPAYSRQSRGQEPEIVSDTGSIESLMGAQADWHDGALDHGVDHGGTAVTEVQPDLGAGTSAQSAAEWEPDPEPAPVAQPFWILAQTERDVHDERGDAIFRIGPTAWALVIEDRGGAYVIRHDDGRIGYLHDITDITRG